MGQLGQLEDGLGGAVHWAVRICYKSEDHSKTGQNLEERRGSRSVLKGKSKTSEYTAAGRLSECCEGQASSKMEGGRDSENLKKVGSIPARGENRNRKPGCPQFETFRRAKREQALPIATNTDGTKHLTSFSSNPNGQNREIRPLWEVAPAGGRHRSDQGEKKEIGGSFRNENLVPHGMVTRETPIYLRTREGGVRKRETRVVSGKEMSARGGVKGVQAT